MAYAEGRTYYDADSHIMELPDFLRQFADPADRDRIPLITGVGGGRSSLGLDEAASKRAHSPEHLEEMLALGDQLIAGPKGYAALGAFNREERNQALDLLGFHRQLVFATFSAGYVFYADQKDDSRYRSARAHNRAMAHFCEKDERLMGVGVLPLDDPQRSVAELEHLLELGLAAAWVPHRPCGGRSPGHNELDPVWARLAEAHVPFVLHVGGHPLQIDPAWMNTGRDVPTDWLGGGENVRGKDMTSLHHMPETFLETMVLDGVFDRHRTLRGGAIELGAGWVPSMCDRLDWVAGIWKKSEPELASLTRKPSEQLAEHMAFTPYPYEDVGTLIRQSNDSLYLFSSDYPHFEGGRHPLGRFGKTLEGIGPDSLDRFYSGNFDRVFAS